MTTDIPLIRLDYLPFQASNPTSTDEDDMGLSLIRAFSDSIQYTREEQKNILLIQKIIRSQPETRITHEITY